MVLLGKSGWFFWWSKRCGTFVCVCLEGNVVWGKCSSSKESHTSLDSNQTSSNVPLRTPFPPGPSMIPPPKHSIRPSDWARPQQASARRPPQPAWAWARPCPVGVDRWAASNPSLGSTSDSTRSLDPRRKGLVLKNDFWTFQMKISLVKH